MPKKHQADDQAGAPVSEAPVESVEPVASAPIEQPAPDHAPVHAKPKRGDEATAELCDALKALIVYAAGVGPSTAPALAKARAVLAKYS